MKKLTVISLALLCACAGAATPDVSMSRADRTVDFLYDPFDPPLDRSIARGDAMERIRARFGEPSDIASEIAYGPNDPTVTAEYLTWSYEGLTIYMQGNVDQDSRWITKMELVSGGHALKYGLGLQVSRSEYEAKLVPALLNSDPHLLRFVSSFTDMSVPNSPSVYTGSVLIVDFDSHGNATKLTWQYGGD